MVGLLTSQTNAEIFKFVDLILGSNVNKQTKNMENINKMKCSGH